MSEKYTSLEHAIRNIVERKNDPCWDGYKQEGMKKKNGKNVPNCVPEETDNMTQAILEGGHTLEEERPSFHGAAVGSLFQRLGGLSPEEITRRLSELPPEAPTGNLPAVIPQDQTAPALINPETATRPDALINPETATRTDALRAAPDLDTITTTTTRTDTETLPAVRTATETLPAVRTATETLPAVRTATDTPKPPRGGGGPTRGRPRRGLLSPGMGGFNLPVTDSAAASGPDYASIHMHMADPYIARGVNEEADATAERSKIENVARPSARRDRVVKQQEIQKKIIDENRSLAATVKKNVEETRKRERNSSPIITNPKTNDPDPDGYPGGY